MRSDQVLAEHSWASGRREEGSRQSRDRGRGLQFPIYLLSPSSVRRSPQSWQAASTVLEKQHVQPWPSTRARYQTQPSTTGAAVRRRAGGYRGLAGSRGLPGSFTYIEFNQLINISTGGERSRWIVPRNASARRGSRSVEELSD